MSTDVNSFLGFRFEFVWNSRVSERVASVVVALRKDIGSVGQPRKIFQSNSRFTTCHIAENRDVNISTDGNPARNHAEIINPGVVSDFYLVSIVNAGLIANADIITEFAKAHAFQTFLRKKCHAYPLPKNETFRFSLPLQQVNRCSRH